MADARAKSSASFGDAIADCAMLYEQGLYMCESVIDELGGSECVFIMLAR
jgi:hypothetical protein